MNYKLVVFCIFLFSTEKVSGQANNLSKRYDSLNLSESLFHLKDEQLINKHQHLRISAMSGYQKGMRSTYGIDNLDSYTDFNSRVSSVYMYNLSKQDILTFGRYKNNRIVLEVEDPSKYRYDVSQGDKEEWMKKNAYCFEYVFTLGTMKNSKILRDELSHFFRVKFGEEKRIVDVLLLVRTSNNDKMKSHSRSKRNYDKRGELNRVPIGRLLDSLNQSNYIVVDETKYKDTVDMSLNINSWNDLVAIRKSLQKYDLNLIPAKREVMMFIIKEIKE